MLFSLYGSVAFTVNQQTNPSWGTRAPRDDLERDQVLGNMHTTGTVPSKIVSWQVPLVPGPSDQSPAQDSRARNTWLLNTAFLPVPQGRALWRWITVPQSPNSSIPRKVNGHLSYITSDTHTSNSPSYRVETPRAFPPPFLVVASPPDQWARGTGFGPSMRHFCRENDPPAGARPRTEPEFCRLQNSSKP